MSEPSSSAQSGSANSHGDSSSNPTIAAFPPNSNTFSSTKQRTTILVHHKSPLLLATPPQVTRALAYSHPFIVPLNQLAGLLSWTTGDPWESFLLVVAFWFITLYGDEILRYTGPLVLVAMLVLGMYTRRYSPLSSTGWTGEKQARMHKREPSDANIKHHKSLDEILVILQTFTTRCNILLDPGLRMTDFLSTQQTATSATTRPALTTLFIRILLASPLWIALNSWPLQILTTQRTCLIFGTLALSWHSRPARISRTILWRSRTVRLVCSSLTGLTFATPSQSPPPLPARNGANTASTSTTSAAALATKRGADGGDGIRFTFAIYENQRRWLGIGWTASMLAYERGPWTDEHLNPVSEPAHFTLPEVDGGMAKWRWAENSVWHVEAGRDASPFKKRQTNVTSTTDDEAEWVYYDNKWRDGQRAQDGWGKYTRRRKWVRDAELVDAEPAAAAKTSVAVDGTAVPQTADSSSNMDTSSVATGTDVGSPSLSKNRKSWFGRSPRDDLFTRPRGSSSGSMGGSTVGGSAASMTGSVDSQGRTKSRTAAHDPEHDVMTPTEQLREKEVEWGLGDDVSMELG